MIYLVLRPGQRTFGRKDLYKSLASAKRKADKVNGVVKLNGQVIYAS